MQILNCFDDYVEWNAVVGRFTTDPHYLSSYYRAFGKEGSLAVLYVRGEPVMAQPFLHQENGWIGNAYNFGGPIGDCAYAKPFAEAFALWKESNRYNERCVLNPLVGGCKLPKLTLESREVVCVDLRATPKFRSTTRHSIEKAKRTGVTVSKVEPTLETITQFVTIYEAALDRLNAAPHWRNMNFSKLFSIVGPRNTALFLTNVEGKIEAGCVLIFDQDNCYYHWAAASDDHRNSGMNHFQVATCITWARGRGQKNFLLGGGLLPDDGIFRFKSGFSDVRLPCYRYETLHNQENVA